MDSEPFEYTKFPGPATKPAAAKPKAPAVSAPAGAAAAAAIIVVAVVFAAGPIFFPKSEAPAPAAETPVLEALEPVAVSNPVPVASDHGEARPESPLPIAFGLAEARARPSARTPTAAITAKPGPKPFRPPSLNGGGSSWSASGKEAGPVAFTPEGGASEAAVAAAPSTENASWTATMLARPITRSVLSFAPGKVRPDYAVDKTERPDYRVDKSFWQGGGGGRGTSLKPVGGGGGCVDCEEAGDAAGIAVGPDGRVVTGGVGAGGGVAGASIGKLTYVGPCEEGQLYRLTNTLRRRLGSTTLIGNSGEVWDVRALQPGESAEIRSRGMISSLSTAP